MSDLAGRELEELAELSCDRTLKIQFREKSLSAFWLSVSTEYPLLSNKKQRKANTVTITNDTDAIQPTQSTQCITAPASPELSLMHYKIDELLRTVRLQQETIKVMSEK